MNQDEMKELMARLPEIEKRTALWETEDVILAFCAAVRELAEENERLRKELRIEQIRRNILASGLRIYADVHNWIPVYDGPDQDWWQYSDNGYDIARAVLVEAAKEALGEEAG